jgi:hypothetical protein
MIKRFLYFVLLLQATITHSQDLPASGGAYTPSVSFEKWLSLKQTGTVALSPNGELDRRVPISDAYELYRGLQDRRIPSRLIVYKGFGHGITKPKERLAAIWHNWQWFAKYIWGEEIVMP